MKLPRGRLLRERVVTTPGTALSSALDRELTGYARLQSQDVLLLDGEGVGVVTFVDGVPAAAYHTGTDRAGRDALADIAVAGPYRLELYELDGEHLETVHDTASFRVPPGLPAEHLAGDPSLAEETRAAAPDAWLDTPETAPDTASPVEEFLEDEETIATIQERAREEARERATEWGFQT